MTSQFPTTYTTDPESGCWVWTGHLDRNGYARCWSVIPGESWAHRVSYILHVGPIPEGRELDHVCSNPPCVNPDHLEPVTKSEHVRRTWERTGRFDECLKAARMRTDGLTYAEIADVLGYAGRNSAWAVVQSAIKWGLIDESELPTKRTLTPDEREDIRDLHALGVSQTELARWYGVDSSNICRVVNRRTSRGRRMAS